MSWPRIQACSPHPARGSDQVNILQPVNGHPLSLTSRTHLGAITVQMPGSQCPASKKQAPWSTTTSKRCERRDIGDATTTGTPAGPAPPALLRVVDGLVGRLAQLLEQDCSQSRLSRVRGRVPVSCG